MSPVSWSSLLKESSALFRECDRVDAMPAGKEQDEAMAALSERARRFSLSAPLERIQAANKSALKVLDGRP